MVYSEALLCSTAVSSLETKQATRVVLYFFLQGCVLTMNGNIFYSNQAGMEGGAISAERSVIHISGNDFLDTYCNTTGNNSPGVWDIILKLKIQGIFDDPLFSLGVAYFSTMRYHNGGAIQLSYGSINVTFGGTSVVFRNNSAPNGYGGALFSHAECEE